MTRHGIVKYQESCQAMVAPSGINRKKQSVGGRGPSFNAFRDNGTASSKCLRKREARLRARQQDWMRALNDNPQIPEGAYRKPGSMR